MPVFGYVGTPGSGKTYAAVERVLKDLKRPGTVVYSNAYIGRRLTMEAAGSSYGPLRKIGRAFVADPRVHLLGDFSDLFALGVKRDEFGDPIDPDCREIVVLLDELGLWAPSRMWADLPTGMLNTWPQSRKSGLTIIYTAQYIDQIDKLIREVTETVTFCRRIGPQNRAVGFVRTEWRPKDVDKPGRHKRLSWSYSRFRQSVADRFDTYRPIDLPAHLLELHGTDGPAGRRRRPAAAGRESSGARIAS